MKKIAAIGEVMLELSPLPSGENVDREIMSLFFAGDTYNTSVYMSRLGMQTSYITQLGDDIYSDKILQNMVEESIDVSLIRQMPGRSPGLYIIRNTPDGEREFYYWRNESPAREMFSIKESIDDMCKKLVDFDCVYISGITLGIIGEKARQNLFQMLNSLREQGVTIAFDSNYRPKLWRDITEARKAILDVMGYTDIALLTLDDEYLLWGDRTINGCKDRYAPFSISELILKRGSESTVVVVEGKEEYVPIPPVQGVIDTTGAGDTFNAGYLAARLEGSSPIAAVQQAIQCASIIICHRGAIIDKSTFLKSLALRPKVS